MSGMHEHTLSICNETSNLERTKHASHAMPTVHAPTPLLSAITQNFSIWVELLGIDNILFE